MPSPRLRLRGELQRQLDSYEVHPEEGEYDRGYKKAIEFAMGALMKVYPQLKKMDRGESDAR